MAGSTIEPLNITAPFTEPKTGRLTAWAIYWLSIVLLGRVQQSAQIQPAGILVKKAQSAALGTTTLVAAANAALYRVSIYAQVTTVAGVSSSINVNILSTYNTQTIPQSLTAQAGNLLTSVCMGVIIVRADAASAISLTTTYASNPANAMVYDLYAEVEAM